MPPKTGGKAAAAPAPASKTAPAPKATPKAASAPAQKPAEKTKKTAAPATPSEKPSQGHNAVLIKDYKLAGKEYSEVRSYFGTFGPLAQLRVKRALTTRNGPYVLAFYKDAASAKKVLDLNGKNVDGQKIHVQPATKAKARRSRADYSTTLFVSPTKQNAKKGDIRKEFESAGKVLRVRKHAQGYSYIFFSSVEDASKAYAKYKGQELFGKKILVKRSLRTRQSHQKKYGKSVVPLKVAPGNVPAATKAKQEKKKAAPAVKKEAPAVKKSNK